MAKKPEDYEIEFQTKLDRLGRVTEKSDQVLASEKKRVIARHVKSLKETISEVNKLLISVEADGKVELEEWLEDLDNRKENNLKKRLYERT